MAQSPAFPLYAKDFYTGTSMLSPSEVGTYMRAIAWSWDNGPLPLDDDERMRACLTTPQEFRRIWPKLSRFWDQQPTGYTNKRLEVERDKQASYRKAQSERGARGGHAKAGTKPEPSTCQPPASLRPASGHDFDIAGSQPEPSFAFAFALAKEQEPVQAEAVQEDPQEPVQSARSAPSFHDPKSRQKLKAAAYAYLADCTDDRVGNDVDMAKAVRDCAACLKLYDFEGRHVNGIVNEVRGYLASQDAKAVNQ